MPPYCTSQEVKNGVFKTEYDFQAALERLTGFSNWEEVNGPDSRCGLDYWYETVDEDGETHSAYINVDQGWWTIEVDEDVIFDDYSDALEHFE